MSFLLKLDKLMDERNINKSQLSKESGVPYTTIDGFYKKGTDNIKLSTLKKLAAYFGCSLDYLADDDVKNETKFMNTLSRIKTLCDKAGIAISQLEKDLNYGNGALSKSKSIKAERLLEIANYFDTTMEYILTGEEKKWQPTTTEKDEKDIMTIGERIKDLRICCGLTQDELAAKLNTTKQTIHKYENNIITNIPSDKVELLASIFGKSPAYIMGWDEGNSTSKYDAFSDDELLFLAIYKSLPVEAQNELKSYMKFKFESYENDPNLKDAEIEAGKIIEEFEKMDNTSNCG